MWRGRFFIFEGLDGAGLTTQAGLLKDSLEKQGYAVFMTKEPTDGPIGGQIRLALSKRLDIRPTALALAFAADRMDHLDIEIIPKFENGVIVISDRYYLSSYAYQSLRSDLRWLMQINAKCLRPSLTILLDTPALVCKKRMERMRWHVELYEEIEKLEVVRKKFLSIANELKKHGERIETIDGNRPVTAVHKDVKKAVTHILRAPPRALDEF